MPDRRTHRGPHPEDARLFGESALPILRQAAADFCWLLNRDYPPTASLALVGNRYQLDQRQRMALARFACSDAKRDSRRDRCCTLTRVRGQTVWLDGFNVLTTVEAALAGAVVLVGRDGSLRDLAGMHGTYRKVEETEPALRLIGRALAESGAGPCRWYFDSPVSNSGRLKTVLLSLAAIEGWTWEVELVANPDPLLKQAATIVATADSIILDACGSWLNLARETVEKYVPAAWRVELEPDTPPR